MTNLDHNRKYKANLTHFEGIEVWFVVTWLLWIKMLCLAVSQNQSLGCQINDMGKTSIISLEHGKQLETRSALDMIRFPVPIIFTNFSH